MSIFNCFVLFCFEWNKWLISWDLIFHFRILQHFCRPPRACSFEHFLANIYAKERRPLGVISSEFGCEAFAQMKFYALISVRPMEFGVLCCEWWETYIASIFQSLYALRPKINDKINGIRTDCFWFAFNSKLKTNNENWNDE